MIVDDHEDVRFLIRAIIEDAAEDVVVLDAVMPVVSGFEAAPMILARRPEQKILLCSALVDEDVRAKAGQAGISDCVSKDDMEAIPALAVNLARDSAP